MVRRKKSCFWSSWLSSQERLSRSNPRLAARDVHEQLGTNQRTLPRSMRCPASGRQVEGNDCLDAWRDHFRAAQPMPPVQGSARVDPTSSEITDRVAALRRVMLTLSGQLDLPFTEAALQNVLSQLPLHRAAGRPRRPPFTNTFFELVWHWAVVPSTWRSARVRLLHKRGLVHEFNNYPSTLANKLACWSPYLLYPFVLSLMWGKPSM